MTLKQLLMDGQLEMRGKKNRKKKETTWKTWQHKCQYDKRYWFQKMVKCNAYCYMYKLI